MSRSQPLLLLTLALVTATARAQAAAPAAPAAPPSVQSDDLSSEEALSTVIVTATKEDTTEFETPASVSVVSGDAVAGAGLDTLSDLAQRLPNVYFSDFTHSTPSLTIRGMGFSDDESDSSSNGVLIDGVPVYPLTLGTLFDIQQMEVLRGPQSTLYGQDSMGGVVAIRTRDPGFAFGGEVQATYGTDDLRRLEAAIDLPLSSDTALRLAGGAEDADGYVHNVALDRDATAGWQSRFGRLKLLHRDGAGGVWRFGLHRVDSHGGNDFFAPVVLADHHESNASDAGVNDVAYTLLTGSYDRSFANDIKLAVVLGGSRADWSYWVPASFYGAPSGYNSHTSQYSAEVRLSRSPGTDSGLDWLAGAYASRQTKDAPYVFVIPGVLGSVTDADIAGDTTAAFGELGWRFDAHWRLAAALRLEYDDRRMDWRSDQSGVYDSDGIADATYATTDKISGLKIHNTVPLPRLTLEYRPDTHQFAWMTLERGYKASGFNLYATDQPSAATLYQPEYGDYAEIGYRLQGATDRWELGAVGFYTRLRDQQVVIDGAQGQSFVTNAGRSHNTGAELNAAVRPWRVLQITAFAGYVEAVYDNYVTGGVNYDGQQFPSTPRQSYGAALDWQPASHWDAGMSVAHFSASNLYPISTVTSPAYTLLGAQLAYHLGRWTLGVYGKNLTDAIYYTRAMDQTTVVAAPPRTLAVRVAANF